LTLASSAALSLLLLAGAASSALVAALRADRLAERNFDAAKSTISSVVFDFVQELQGIEGMSVESARRILERAETSIGELASRTDNDPEAQRIQGATYGVFAGIYLKLGATELATNYARKATQIARSLTTQDPTNTLWRRDLTLSLEKLAEVLLLQGDLAGS